MMENNPKRKVKIQGIPSFNVQTLSVYSMALNKKKCYVNIDHIELY